MKRFEQVIPLSNFEVMTPSGWKDATKLIQTGMEMLPDVVQSVAETQSDKAINAATGFLKVLGELNKSLVDLNNDAIGKPVGKGTQPQQAQIENQTNNVIIVEDSADIFRLASQKQIRRDFESD